MKTRQVSWRNLLISFVCASARKTIINEVPDVQERLLIITADDFGASKNINEGIKKAADEKAITSISVLSNFSESLQDLKQISENHPDIGIGIHLNITTGKPVLGADQVPSLISATGNFYTLEDLLCKVKHISPDELRKELKAQIIALTKHDIRIDHLSDHNGILSLYNPFFDIITELAKEFNVPVRTPVIAGVKYRDMFPDSRIRKHGFRIASRLALSHPFKALNLLKYSGINEMEKKANKLDELKILHPDLLIEYFWGNPTATNFLYILEHLPAGISELVLHVGTGTRQENYPSGLDLDYFKNRENELATITGDRQRELISSLNIRTTGYSNMPNDLRKKGLAKFLQ
jgi:predicted glycoside hydrolase/deacetylase ChbG (UPF0249 family)